MALARRDAADKHLRVLLATPNRHVEGHPVFSVKFLRSQWEIQRQFQATHTEEATARAEKFAEFFQNEEILGKTM